MNISDAIRNIQWYDLNGPLESEKKNLYDEFFALAVLRYCYPEKYNDYKIADKPDLQHIDKKTGVEVTSAINEDIASIEGNYAKYQITQKSKEKARLKLQLEKSGCCFDQFGLFYLPENSIQERKVIETVIEKKVNKLTFYKDTGFEKMELFIRHPNIPCICSENTFIELFEKANGYETVYFCASSCLMVYRHAEKHLLIEKIPNEDYSALGTIARLTVDGKIKPDSKVWETAVYDKL